MIRTITSILILLVATELRAEPVLVSPPHGIGDGGTVFFTLKSKGEEIEYYVDGRAFDDPIFVCCDTYGSVFIGYPDAENSLELQIGGKEERRLINELSIVLMKLKGQEAPEDLRMHKAILLDLEKLLRDLKECKRREEVRTKRSRQLRQNARLFHHDTMKSNHLRNPNDSLGLVA